jgi:hypothetical protein
MKQFVLILSLSVAMFIPSVVLGASVAPSVLELEANRSELIDASITVINTGEADQTYYLDTIGFQSDDDGQSPTFFEENEADSVLANWIKFDEKELIVPAHTQAKVSFQIFVPDSAQDGGHYAAVTVATSPFDVVASNGAIIEAKTAVLVLLSVGGTEMNPKAAILDLVSLQKQGIKSLPWGEYTFRIQNQGNVHVKPTGTLSFTDMFGRTIASTPVNTSEGRVLPSSTRTYEATITSKTEGWIQTASKQMSMFAAGPISAVLEIDYGGEEKLLMVQSDFWLIPWQLIVSLFLMTAVLLLMFVLGRRKQK